MADRLTPLSGIPICHWLSSISGGRYHNIEHLAKISNEPTLAQASFKTVFV